MPNDNELPTIKDRLQAAFDVVIVEANIPKALQTLVSSFFTNFMTNTDEVKLGEMLVTMRDELIPFILEGEGEPVSLPSVTDEELAAAARARSLEEEEVTVGSDST